MKTLNELIKSVGFCESNQRQFPLDDGTDLPYYCCKLGYPSKEYIQPSIYARFLIIDLRDERTKKVCEQYVFSAFSEFQKKHLAKVFFYENESVRFNIYLVFITDGTVDLRINQVIQDTNYSRKYFFNESEFEEYFSLISQIDNSIRDSSSSKTEVYHLLLDVVEKLDNDNAKCLLLPTKSDSLIEVLRYLSSDSLTLDSYFMNNQKPKDFLATNFYSENETVKNKCKRIERIEKLIIKKFFNNCFKTDTVMNAVGVNIISGDNASGKSTLFDAIEYGFTNETHRYGKEKEDINEVKIFTKPDVDITKYSEADRKNSWYPDFYGELDELFCRINFFDTDAAFRFALEQGQESQKYLEKLFCNKFLLEGEENLKKYSRSIQVLIETVESQDDFKKKILPLFLNRKKTIGNIEMEEILQRLKKLDCCCQSALKSLKMIKKQQIDDNIQIINLIFRRLFSYNYHVIVEKGNVICLDDGKNHILIDYMSTAQKVCVALSIMFTQFLSAQNAPNFILLDESVANLDSFHLLSLFDFLRELYVKKGVQVFFSTASSDVLKVAKAKFQFLNDEYVLTEIIKDEKGISTINH